jgi:hypothetical protein
MRSITYIMFCSFSVRRSPEPEASAIAVDRGAISSRNISCGCLLSFRLCIPRTRHARFLKRCNSHLLEWHLLSHWCVPSIYDNRKIECCFSSTLLNPRNHAKYPTCTHGSRRPGFEGFLVHIKTCTSHVSVCIEFPSLADSLQV